MAGGAAGGAARDSADSGSEGGGEGGSASASARTTRAERLTSAAPPSLRRGMTSAEDVSDLDTPFRRGLASAVRPRHNGVKLLEYWTAVLLLYY